jgi:membrane protein insertase Oxa1/YidC/SpoIIIJ
MFYFCGMKIILWGLLIYFLYNLIFRVVVPASKVASQMKDKVREMQQQQEEARKKFEQQQQYQHQAEKAAEVRKNEDYIDFEEIK